MSPIAAALLDEIGRIFAEAALDQLVKLPEQPLEAAEISAARTETQRERQLARKPAP